jgi:hypothetical protein
VKTAAESEAKAEPPKEAEEPAVPTARSSLLPKDGVKDARDEATLESRADDKTPDDEAAEEKPGASA